MNEQDEHKVYAAELHGGYIGQLIRLGLTDTAYVVGKLESFSVETNRRGEISPLFFDVTLTVGGQRIHRDGKDPLTFLGITEAPQRPDIKAIAPRGYIATDPKDV
ncbi:hypothetical protein RBS60_10880 [Sinomonas sp. ASV486]|uniref:hypothetical protein n=1 Tax=Sinomonas sp. ASV486 TaxID=3051170 RepID=UPI0027DC46A6|nr:hypothetical protein [Sinomonas sp. ASV486]MDQ4490702.1 hypothetical protein [Sinomonas sp. ASV486]